MAFHVACPITCRRICHCTLGFPQKLRNEKGRSNFLEEISRVEEFLIDPWSLRVTDNQETVQVTVPKIVKPVLPVTVRTTTISTTTTAVDGFGGGSDVFGSGGGGGGDADEIWSIQKKQAYLQKKAAADSLVAEDFARRFETGTLVDINREKAQDLAGEALDPSALKIMCRLCYSGENEGSERAMKMLPCKICGKKYHRSCIKSWAQYRDLFHWSSWACPCCRSCEVCRRAGDGNKLMFCKRCDGAYHCYCQQPPHKNVSAGPYLCPKHTRCHSCASTVPGSGLSTRWFLGYNYCDACGRLFVKGKYCPVCLKVYRDSESTPMVCCDACERWVHCQCDGISDEKYLQFQVDGNLYYKCAACRGECYQVKDHDDAIQELWRRRDIADQEQIASLRAAAGLPCQEEIFSISPYSDDEENDAIMKSGYGRSLKISVKGLGDKTTKSSKEYGKKSSNKKYMKKKGHKVSSSKTAANQNFERLHDAQSLECSLGDERNDDVLSYGNERKDIFSPPLAIGPGGAKENCCINQAGSMQHGFSVDGEVVGNNEGRAPRVLHIKTAKSHGLDHGEGSGRHASKSETVKGTKLVIHLGTRNRNITSSPISEASSCCHREQDLAASYGSEGTSQRKAYMVEAHDGITRHGDGKGEKLDSADQLKGSRYRTREGNLIKLGKVKSDFSEMNHRTGGVNMSDRHESLAMERSRVSVGRGTEERTGVVDPLTEGTPSRNDDVLLRRHSRNTPTIHGESHTPPVSESLPRDPKPLLKLKFKNPYVQNRSSWVPQGEEEKTFIKGQRSKRKRPSPVMEKVAIREDEGDSQLHPDNQIDEAIDANWILKKLGKDAIGKRVEVHQPSDSSWHKGVVTDAIEGTSTLAVRLDDGQANTLELGKQRIRFVSHKQKRSRT